MALDCRFRLPSLPSQFRCCFQLFPRFSQFNETTCPDFYLVSLPFFQAFPLPPDCSSWEQRIHYSTSSAIPPAGSGCWRHGFHFPCLGRRVWAAKDTHCHQCRPCWALERCFDQAEEMRRISLRGWFGKCSWVWLFPNRWCWIYWDYCLRKSRWTAVTTVPRVDRLNSRGTWWGYNQKHWRLLHPGASSSSLLYLIW